MSPSGFDGWHVDGRCTVDWEPVSLPTALLLVGMLAIVRPGGAMSKSRALSSASGVFRLATASWRAGSMSDRRFETHQGWVAVELLSRWTTWSVTPAFWLGARNRPVRAI